MLLQVGESRGVHAWSAVHQQEACSTCMQTWLQQQLAQTQLQQQLAQT
jgi:hypothetical protein